MHVSILWWAGTLGLIALLLTVDLILSGHSHRQTARSSARWVAFYVVAALLFAVAVGAGFGSGPAGQFLAGWLTEYSLSIDNLFVFLVLMNRFGVPQQLQLRVLTFGVVIALVLRGVLIAVGAVAIARFSWVFYLFGALLIHTAWTMIRPSPAPAEDDEEVPATASALSRLIPSTRVWHGTRLFVRENGHRRATPLLLTMLTIGVTDVLFALDSIPAIFGLTTEAFLVVSANAFALIGLRQLFFVVRGLLDRLEHLNKGLSLVLAFIGVKLILEAMHETGFGWAPEIPTWVSLAVVVGLIGGTAAVSLVLERRRARTHGHDGEREPADVH